MLKQLRHTVLSFSLIALAGCSSSGGGGSNPDGGTGPDGGGAGAAISFLTWTLDWSSAGKHASIVSLGDRFGVAHYRTNESSGSSLCGQSFCSGPSCGQTTCQDTYCDCFTCDSVDVYQSTNHLIYVEPTIANWGGTVTASVVDTRNTGVTNGLSIVYDPATQRRYIGYLGGNVATATCDSSDAYIASSTNGTSWNNPAEREYADSSTGGFSENAAGHWMSVGLDSTGQIHAAYRDVRSGGFQAEDENSASLRYGATVSSPLWSTVANNSTGSLNTDNSSGEYATLLFNGDDPVILHQNTTSTNRRGLWVSYRDGSGTWQPGTRILSTVTGERPGFATDGNGRFGVVYYDPTVQSLFYRETTDLVNWSAPEAVDLSATAHGLFASLVYDSNGNPAASYFRCGNAGSSETSCPPGEDGVMFAYKRNGVWTTVEVDEGGTAQCGTYTSIAFSSAGEPLIAYRCNRFDSLAGSSGEIVPTLSVARGVWQ